MRSHLQKAIMANIQVVATFEGYIDSIEDANLLLDACIVGILPQVPRRLQVDERFDLIKSGNIFIYEKGASSIKRWTDGRSWSSRRSLGQFYIYSELENKKGSMPKKGGLVRKMLDLTRDSVSYQLVSYFTVDDVQRGIFVTPSSFLQSGSLGIDGEMCSETHHWEDTWQQLSYQLTCLSPVGDFGWDISQPRLDQAVLLDIDEEFNWA